MRFAEPQWLWALLLAPTVAVAFWLSSVRRRAMLRRFAGGVAHVERFVGDVSPHRRAVKALLLVLAVASGVLALARPQWGTGLETITRSGADVVLLMDTSRSMAATDVPPDRLSLARHAAGSLVDHLGGDRIALVSFAGEANLACPLTLDQGAVQLFIDTLDAETVAVPGTAIEDAVREAVRAFGPLDAAASRGRLIVLFSDGEDHEGGIDEALAELRKANVALFAIGIGTERGATVPDPEETGSWLKDRQGRIVTTRLDEATLRRLAVDSGGRYYRATPAGLEIEEIARAVAGLEGATSGTILRTRYEERFQIPLALALAALVAEVVVSERRRRKEAVR